MIELESVRMKFPEDTNIIIGQTHFIKTAEDMYEAVVNTVPQAKFGLAFNESSGPCLIRAEGNDDELRNARSEEHTSELQSRLHLVCRLLLEKKKKAYKRSHFDDKHSREMLNEEALYANMSV